MTARSQRLRRIVSAGVPHRPTLHSHSETLSPNSENSASSAPPAEEGQKPTGAEALAEFDWWREHEALSARYGWQKAAYILWSASPATGRKPPTQAQFVSVIGLRTDRTIRQWLAKDTKGEIKAEIAAQQAAPLLRHRRDIFDALVKSATDDSPASHPDRKLALEMMGDYRPKASITSATANVDLSALTDAQLDRVIAGEDLIQVLLDGYRSAVASAGREGETKP